MVVEFEALGTIKKQGATLEDIVVAGANQSLAITTTIIIKSD